MPKPKAVTTKGSAGARPVRVRMYRHGLGDCHLVTLPTTDGKDFNLMIDCGVILGTPQPELVKLSSAVDDVVAQTKGRVDVLVVTHEHWDHVSGFTQANESFAKLAVDELWMAWTEDPRDALAKTLRAEKAQALNGLRCAAAAIGPALGPGGAQVDNPVTELLGFFGAASGPNTTAAAMTAARALLTKSHPGAQPRYLSPTDQPLSLPRLGDIRIYALGPPRAQAALKKLLSPRETYGLSASAFHAAAVALGSGSVPEENQPFEPSRRLDLEALRGGNGGSDLETFFQEHYFGRGGEAAWRQIDADWLNAAQDFALNLDSATNNTSLVLAIELSPGGKVLLFAADAQVGSWLSWQELSWTLPDGRRVTGPDLLKRTVFYKVGHHGSHNATLREKGLEQMEGEGLMAFVPVNEEMAKKKRWGQMPLPALMTALDKQTGGRVVRSDRGPQKGAGWVTAAPLYLEVTVTP